MMMRAMILERPNSPLQLKEVPRPIPREHQVLIKVLSCGICRTDLHVVDGELPNPALPLIPGHQIVGLVIECGSMVNEVPVGARVGVPWLGGSCGRCLYCQSGRENLCDHAQYTGYQLQGGFAEYCVADARYIFPIPHDYSDEQAAPLLCAGLIGYRALRMAGEARKIGLYGFGASAHILAQVAKHQGRKTFAFTRPNDIEGQQFALQLGAVWAGDTTQSPPEELDAALIFAPEGSLIPFALSHVCKGGSVIAAGIHMSDIPSYPYSLLWGERIVRSVANLTRQDGRDFLELAPKVPIRTRVTVYALEQANQALDDLRHGRFKGAAVLKINT